MKTPHHKTAKKLAKAWISYCNSPESAEGELALHLDALLRKRLPAGHYKGVIKGQEDEVRQEAYLLLVQRYLAGNAALFAATARGDEGEIANQIDKSLRGSLKSVARTLKKGARRRLKTHDYDADVDALCGADHPANRRNFWALPFEAQRALVFSVLRRAAEQNRLPRRSVEIASDMLGREMSQSWLAKSRGISRQAVHQHVARVRDLLKREIRRTEFPMRPGAGEGAPRDRDR